MLSRTYIAARRRHTLMMPISLEACETKPWAIRRMIELCESQLGIAAALSTWVDLARDSPLYRQEAGLQSSTAHGGQERSDAQTDPPGLEKVIWGWLQDRFPKRAKGLWFAGLLLLTLVSFLYQSWDSPWMQKFEWASGASAADGRLAEARGFAFAGENSDARTA